MKKNMLITLFITVHIGFLFFQIHKQMLFMKQSFLKQKQENLLHALQEKKVAKQNELHALQNRSNIKEIAENRLGLKPVSLKQVHRHGA